MSYIQGEGRHQGILFPANHVRQVIDAFVNAQKMVGLGFEQAEAADTGRRGYDPRDLLKLYRYGYLTRIRSSRRLEELAAPVEACRPRARTLRTWRAEERCRKLVSYRVETWFQAISETPPPCCRGLDSDPSGRCARRENP
jgi:hypothetical protein